nr:O-antigen ligase family protein [Micromonospora sp. DSM 115978]
VSAAQRQLVVVFGAIGVCLLIADGVRDRARLDTFLRRLVLGATFMSFIAFVQYVFGRDLSDWFVPPGVQFNSTAAAAIDERSQLRRVAGTAGHAIEFGVVLAMLLPLALHFAMTATGRRDKLLAWAQVTVIGIGLPLSISRSAVLSLAVALLALVTVWNWRRRLNFGVVFVGFVGVFNVAVPGVLGTLRALFLWADEDPSVTGRTEDYAQVGEFFAQRPFLGRGYGTFIPSEYFFL